MSQWWSVVVKVSCEWFQKAFWVDLLDAQEAGFLCWWLLDNKTWFLMVIFMELMDICDETRLERLIQFEEHVRKRQTANC